jgi:hypothetical protein
VTLPDGQLALVAPGETTPRRTRINGVDMEGPAIRFIQMSANLQEFSGLGLTDISGVVTFAESAAFSLRRSPDQVVHLMTNTGCHLTAEWMGGSIRHVEVLDLNHQWIDVTKASQHGSLPVELVNAWKECNQRNLIEFRINA